MNEFEKKLQAFRSREAKKKRIEQLKNTFVKPVSFLFTSKPSESPEIQEQVNSEPSSVDNEASKSISIPDTPLVDEESPAEESFSWKKVMTYFVIWCGLFRYAIYIQFGAVFIILSGFYLIWANTRTGPRKVEELSAYSVFNPNCERIEGTLDAEQFEKELRYGMIL